MQQEVLRENRRAAQREKKGREKDIFQTENRQKTHKSKSFVNLYFMLFFDIESYPQVWQKHPVFLWILWITCQKGLKI